MTARNKNTDQRSRIDRLKKKKEQYPTTGDVSSFFSAFGYNKSDDHRDRGKVEERGFDSGISTDSEIIKNKKPKS